MEFKVEETNGIVVIVAPKIDLHDYMPLENYAEQMGVTVDENINADIIMDLQHVGFAGTPVLAGLVRAHLSAIRRERKFAICNLTSFIEDVVHKVRLERILMIFPTVEDATAAINAPGKFYTHEDPCK